MKIKKKMRVDWYSVYFFIFESQGGGRVEESGMERCERRGMCYYSFRVC